ncbi:MAG: DUF488 domain-containing protein [Flavobacteriaceae bacterium]|nr:DUF488 domain-containing protein [Flavobacteriaceae bacterium]
MKSSNTIYSIGHSSRRFEAFLALLQQNKIEFLADVRRFPLSKNFPHFNAKNLAAELQKIGIQYEHLENLGGRRKLNKNSKNTLWRNSSFRAYADYTDTEIFKNSLEYLEKLALKKTTAYMCSEAVWWRCHRAIISDLLKVKGWKVLHIMGVATPEEHPYTSAARIIDGKVLYYDPDLYDV